MPFILLNLSLLAILWKDLKIIINNHISLKRYVLPSIFGMVDAENHVTSEAKKQWDLSCILQPYKVTC